MWHGEDLRALSLGTGTRTEPISPGNGGIIGWLPDLVSLFMDAQASVLHHLARWAVPGTLVRCDIALGPGVNTAFDDASPANLTALAALGRQLVTAEVRQCTRRFGVPTRRLRRRVMDCFGYRGRSPTILKPSCAGAAALTGLPAS